MKRILLASAVLAGTALLSMPAAAADVGVSISVGQPGFYGHLDIGGFPPPPVVYAQPVIVAPPMVQGPPVYLHVPPGHMKHWDRHCHEYNACGQRVFFVRDGWYQNEYVPRYREMHRDRYDDRGGDRYYDRGGDRGGDRGDRRDHGHGHDRDR